MEFNSNTGELVVNENIRLAKYMNRAALLKTSRNWEIWMTRGNEISAYKLVFKPEGLNEEIILIAFMNCDDDHIGSWHFSPSNGMDGKQPRPEGKFTKKMRTWFIKNFQKKLPIIGEWGRIDAAYDYHNQTTLIVCHYRNTLTSQEPPKSSTFQ